VKNPTSGPLERVMHNVAVMRGTTVREIRSRNQWRSIVEARHLAMTACRRLGYSYPRIAEAFRRDHSTVIYAVRKTEARALAGGETHKLAQDIRTASAGAKEPQPPNASTTYGDSSAYPQPLLQLASLLWSLIPDAEVVEKLKSLGLK